jgi:hypothetical protein
LIRRKEMASERYCVVSPEPLRCIENTIKLDVEEEGGIAYKLDFESRGYLVLPEPEAQASYLYCPDD